MTFSLGIFDLFTYMIPGSLHLAFLTYVGVRLNLIELDDANRIPTGVLLVAMAIVSYLLGHLTYTPSVLVDRLSPSWRSGKHDARRTFLRRVPEASHRLYVHASRNLLITSAQLHDRESAVEIARLRAVGLMVRNACIPLLLGFVASVVEIVVGTNRPLAAGSAALFLVAAVLGARQGRILREWSDLKTLEICYWVPDIDEKIRAVQEGNVAAAVAKMATSAEDDLLPVAAPE
jgi:hypothetical protein